MSTAQADPPRDSLAARLARVLLAVPWARLRERSARSRQRTVDALPRHRLQPAQGCRVLASRAELLRALPPGGVVAEIGVDQGGSSEAILAINAPRRLHLVDSWGSERYGEAKRRGVEARFAEAIREGRVAITRLPAP